VFYIAKNHCFTDGSKRAALMSLIHLLRLNRLEPYGDQEEVAALINAW
jgi:prophage maintenance system killer protein